MRKSFISFLLFSIILHVHGQQAYYDHIKLGEYEINFSDTIIYDQEIQYNQFGYSGFAPLFVQIWFPSTKLSDEKRMNFGEFRNQNVSNELSLVYKKLTAQMDEIFIRDAIDYNIGTGELISYVNYSNETILEKIKLISTRSIRSKIDTIPNCPVIVYHHGSQGLSYENSIMAEFFASNGYVFIAANFHLPFENTIYGLLPYEIEKENKHSQSSAKALITFAKSITNQNTAFFIGHSWGAQEGWCFLNDSSLVEGFVSLETTLEYKTDSSKIRELWPFVFDAIKVKKNSFSIPILSFAAEDKNLSFDFFKGLSSERMIFASYKEPFSHNSYTSMFMLRYFLNPQINQPDSEILFSQIKGYAQHLKMIHAFIESSRSKQFFENYYFEQYFSFH